jgi:hypothetical protein
MSSTVWVDSIIAQLDLLSTTCGHCPQGEFLQVKKLNEILEKFAEARGKFLLICDLNDFHLERKS